MISMYVLHTFQIIHASQASYDNGCRIADASMNENIMCQKD